MVTRKELKEQCRTAERMNKMVCDKCRPCLCEECQSNLKAHDRDIRRVHESLFGTAPTQGTKGE